MVEMKQRLEFVCSTTVPEAAWSRSQLGDCAGGVAHAPKWIEHQA